MERILKPSAMARSDARSLHAHPLSEHSCNGGRETPSQPSAATLIVRRKGTSVPIVRLPTQNLKKKKNVSSFCSVIFFQHGIHYKMYYKNPSNQQHILNL